jgi:hypothetical protein
MQTVKLISWDDYIDKKAAKLKRRGLYVNAAPLIKTSGFIGELARLSPAALVLDLDRLPAQSREIAIALRSCKSTRHIPSSSPAACRKRSIVSAYRSQMPASPAGPKLHKLSLHSFNTHHLRPP